MTPQPTPSRRPRQALSVADPRKHVTGLWPRFDKTRIDIIRFGDSWTRMIKHRRCIASACSEMSR